MGAAGRLRGGARGRGGAGVRAAGTALAADHAGRELDRQPDGEREYVGERDGQFESGQPADRDRFGVGIGVRFRVAVGESVRALHAAGWIDEHCASPSAADDNAAYYTTAAATTIEVAHDEAVIATAAATVYIGIVATASYSDAKPDHDTLTRVQ